ncbi:MAG: hypothetical protein JJU27_10985 [Gammaproteobacteria bacterium]|nr:hypothetical protein [Gammaproteobacteria bacterium]
MPERATSKYAAWLWLTMVAFSPAGSLTAQELSREEIATIEGEVKGVLQDYYQTFVELKADQLPERVFHIPWFQVGATEIDVLSTATEAEDYIRSFMDHLIELGWARSIYTPTNVCVINPSVAIVSGYNTRVDTSGETMMVIGVSYLLGRSGDKWLILSFFSHSKDRPVRCD